jgi:hypothetical protein
MANLSREEKYLPPAPIQANQTSKYMKNENKKYFDVVLLQLQPVLLLPGRD